MKDEGKGRTGAKKREKGKEEGVERKGVRGIVCVRGRQKARRGRDGRSLTKPLENRLIIYKGGIMYM